MESDIHKGQEDFESIENEIYIKYFLKNFY